MEPHGYAIVIEYDGRAYYGWQRLKDKPSVQGALERAVAQACSEQVRVTGAGRTDRGAHATGQVAGFQLAADPSPEALAAALNDALPDAIRVHSARRVPVGFKPREAAVGKRYEYRIYDADPLPPELDLRVWKVRERLDVDAMRAALPALVGRHDFATFATPTRFGQKSTVRELRVAELTRDGPLLTLAFEADGFLYHMVRNLVRAVVKVGEGRLRPAQLADLLAACARQASPGSAPASGLYLVRVDYPGWDQCPR